MNKCTIGGGKLGGYWGKYTLCLSCILVYSVCWAGSDHYPLPNAGSFTLLKWMGGRTEQELKGEDCQGGGGREGGEGEG